MISLARTLDAYAEHFPAALLPLEVYRPTRTVAAQLPAQLTRWTYLECRLGGAPAPADLIVEVDADGRDLLMDPDLGLAMRRGAAGDPVWRRVVDLCRDWANPAAPLRQWIQCLWLEFDVAGREPRPVAAPGVFVGFTPAARRGDAGERSARILAVLRPLLGGEVDPDRAASLRHCVASLPPGCRALYAGALLPRGDGSLRLCVSRIPGRTIAGFLRTAGWPGSYEALDSVLATLDATRAGAAARDPALLHLDIGPEGVRHRLGLEYVFGRREQVRGVLAERGFLEHLVAAGLCTGREAAALAGFPGCGLRTLPHELWRSLVVRRVNHVKLVLDAGGAMEAKGYLVFHHRFWSRAAAGRQGVERPL